MTGTAKIAMFPLTTALIACVALGCGGSDPPVVNDVRDPAIYAKSTQTRVERAVKGIRNSPATAQQRIDRLVDTLQKYPNAPVGDNEQLYAELLGAAQDLKRKIDARSNDLSNEFDRLTEIAQRLPTPTTGPGG